MKNPTSCYAPVYLSTHHCVLMFLVFPGITSLFFILSYFSGNATLVSLVVPKLDTMQQLSWREFGLLEMLQNIYLLTIIWFTVAGSKRQTQFWQKNILRGAALLTTVVLLEEIDYGLHYYEWLLSIPTHEAIQQRNLHNHGDGSLLQNIRRVVDTLMAILFLALPIFFKRSHHPLVRFIMPSPWFIVTALTMIALSELAHALDELGFGDGRIGANISEFRELTMYYMFLLYFYFLAQSPYAKRLPAPFIGLSSITKPQHEA